MVNIPSDITTPEEVRHWLRVNGHSAEKAEAVAAEWSAATPVAPISMPAPSPVIDEEDEDWDDEDEDWDDDEIDEEE